MVFASIAITVFSFLVWVHHFFTMGAGAAVNAFFGIMTMVIAIPTGVKIFNWLFTMFRGRIIFSSMMYWFLGFVAAFTIGGMTGVLLAIPAADFELHNSLFLVAHFHNTIISGVLFSYFAGLTFWFPKIWGFKLNERIGILAFWCWIIGFFVAFMPLYILGFMGATRRLDHYDASTGWQGLFIVAGIGVAILVIGALLQVLQLYVSIRDRKKNLDTTGDPWNGRSLEWSIPSPAPFYNFAITPHVYGHDAFWAEKNGQHHERHYEDIELPRNSPFGPCIGMCSFIFGFALVWHVLWLIPLSFIGILTCIIARSFDEHPHYVINASEMRELDRLHRRI